MKGLRIKYGRTEIAAAGNGLTYVLVNCLDGKASISVRGSYPLEGKSIVWTDDEMDDGDKVEISFGEVDEISIPAIEKPRKIMSETEMKAERFRRLEQSLKERGLL